ncbi:MAG TPA: DedA family protein [Longimicrobiales bacterium]|nr:DedA family protein [Longimicrobiales bacterium]
MGATIEQWLRTLAELPPAVTYLFIGAGAGLENIVPAIPADTFVLFGAFLSANGRASVFAVFLVTWLANIATAIIVYWLARGYGTRFFSTRVGNALLRPAQLEQIAVFYARWGVPAIFVGRFLPGFRALIPVFAGISNVSAGRVIPPVAIASGIWYGLVVYAGAIAGNNWRTILRAFEAWGDVLLAVAALLGLLVAWWWWRSRRHG